MERLMLWGVFKVFIFVLIDMFLILNDDDLYLIEKQVYFFLEYFQLNISNFEKLNVKIMFFILIVSVLFQVLNDGLRKEICKNRYVCIFFFKN